MQDYFEHKKKTGLSYLLISSALLVISCWCILLQSESRPGYALWTLPAAFTFFYILTGSRLSFRQNPCLIVLYLVMAIRYVVVPLAAFSAGPDSLLPESYNRNQAILLSLWEMLWVSLAILWFLYGKSDRNSDGKSGFKDAKIKISNWSVGLVIFGAVAVVCLNPSLLGSSDILVGKVDSDLLKINTGISGVFTILWGVGRSFIYLGLLNLIIRKYRRSRKYRLVVFAVLLTLLFTASIFTGGIRVARWGMVIAFLSSFYLLSGYFSEHRRTVFLLTFVPSLLFLLVATSYKNFSANLNQGIDFGAILPQLFDFELLNSYFGGFKNVSYAVEMCRLYHPSILNLFSDSLKNMPYFSNFVNPEQTTTYLFNRAVYGFFPANDRIVPMIGQGLGYFGVFFSPVFSVLSVACMFRFNALSKKSSSLYLKYITLYAGYFFSVFMCLNLSILLSILYSAVLPFLFFILLNYFGPKREAKPTRMRRIEAAPKAALGKP